MIDLVWESWEKAMSGSIALWLCSNCVTAFRTQTAVTVKEGRNKQRDIWEKGPGGRMEKGYRTFYVYRGGGGSRKGISARNLCRKLQALLVFITLTLH